MTLLMSFLFNYSFAVIKMLRRNEYTLHTNYEFENGFSIKLLVIDNSRTCMLYHI